MTQSKCANNFILTINEQVLPHYQEIIAYLEGRSGFNYILVTEHTGQENKHYHCYVQYNRSLRLSMEMLCGAHLDKCYGSAQANIEYCRALDDKHKKLGVTAIDIYENGKPLFKGSVYSVGDLLEINDIENIPDYRMTNAWKLAHEIKENEPIDIEDWKKEVKVYWIQGPSGIGKTEKAKQIVRDNKEKYGTKVDIIKFVDRFWHGVSGLTPIAIYDDFRDSHMKPSEFINFIDYNVQKMNVKGRTKHNNYSMILITSVQRLSEIYGNVKEEPRKQWERRIEVIDLFPGKILTTSNGQLNSRDYVEDNECYYCDNNIDCKCKCIENNTKCNEKQCNLDKFNFN